MRRAALPVLAAAALAACLPPARPALPEGQGQAPAPSAGAPHMIIETERGEIVVRFLGDPASGAPAAFARLAAEPSVYAGTVIDRVVPGLLARAGARPAGEPVPAPGPEGEQGNPGPFDRAGLVGFTAPSAGGEFFITLGPAPWLAGRARVFGEVVSGLELVGALASSPRRLYDEAGRRVDLLERPLGIRGIRVSER